MRVIGITQRVDLIASYGERRDALDQQWSLLLGELGWMAVPLPNHGDPAAVLRRLDLDGVLLSGGNDLCELPDASGTAPERDRFENGLIEAAVQAGRPVFGVCRGLQLIAARHGARLSRLAGHVATTHEITPTAAAIAAGWHPDPRLVNSYHGWGIRPEQLGGDLVPLALAADGSVEALAVRGSSITAIMWHPERGSRAAADAALLRACFEATSAATPQR